jgi:hypothetical protein
MARADMLQEVEELRKKNSVMMGKVESLTHRIEELEDAMKLMTYVVNNKDRKGKCQDPNISSSDGTKLVRGVEDFLVDKIRSFGSQA